MATTPRTADGVVRIFKVKPGDVRNTDEGVEVTCKGAAQILDMKASSVRRRHYRGDIEGEVRGRDLWMPLASVLNYLKNRKPAGRPIETGAGVRRRERERARASASAASSRPAPKRTSKAGGKSKKSGARKK